LTSLIAKNPGMKLLALAIAAALWIVVSGEEESVRTYNVPLDFTALSRDRTLSGDTPNSVQVRVRGSDSVLRSLAADDLRIPIDLSRLRPGERAVEALSPQSVQGIPSGAAVDAIAPEAVPLLVERRISRAVHLQARLEGTPAKGFVIGKVDLDPDHVVFEGPESELAPLSMSATESILLDGRSQTFIVMVGVPLPSPRIRFAEARPVKVTVHIEREHR
jgi:YbbR domain-containing protein